MKNFYLSITLLFIAFSGKAVSTSINGKPSVCPNEETTYTVSMNVGTFKRAYIRITNGIILENNSTEITIYPVDGYYFDSYPTVTIKWNNQAGLLGKVRAIGYYDLVSVEFGDSEELDVIIGSPPIGQFTASYVASCGEDRSAFTIDPVRGATSYQWTNTLGWSFNSGGSGTTTLFNSLTPTLSGIVSVTAINANCPSTNSTRTINVNRSVTIPVIQGQDVVPPSNFADYITVKGSNFNWSPPTGWTIVGPQGYYYMQVQAPNLNLPGGYLTVTYTDACGVSGSNSKFISTEEYLPEFTDPGDETFKVYPNPVSNDLFIESDANTDFVVLIRNNYGELIYTSKQSANDNIIDISKLKEGNYFVDIVQGIKTHTQRL